jgi:hypothetical protein
MDHERPEYFTNNKYFLTHDESIVDFVLKFAARTQPTSTSQHELCILIINVRLKVT